MPTSIPVYLDSLATYEKEPLKEAFGACFSVMDHSSLRAANVFLKPNLLTGLGNSSACTHPHFLLALVEYLTDHGARVSIGDSPAFGSASAVLARLGIIDNLRKSNVRIVDLRKVMKQRLSCGLDIGLAAEPLACDLFINVPKVKAHSQMYVTLATKNLFGIVQGMRKSMLHMRHGDKNGMFCRIIVDLVDVLPPHITIIDGIIAMHQTGPVHGVPLELGCLGSSADPIALDTSLLQLLELEKRRSPLWREARRRGCPGTFMNNINHSKLTPEYFYGSAFIAPEQLSPIRFNPFRFVRGMAKRLSASFSA